MNTDQKNRFRELRNGLEASKRWRRTFEPAWRDYQLIYPGRHDRPNIGVDDPPFVNLLLSTVQVAVAASTVEDPSFEALPRTPKYAEYQPIVEGALDVTWESTGAQKEFSEALTDRFVTGDGWIKTTWERIEASGELDPALVDEMEKNILLVASVRGLGPDEIPSRAQVEAHVLKNSMSLISNRAIVRRLDPFSVFVDSRATSDKDCQWYAQKVWLPLDEVRNNESFSKKARQAVKATNRLMDDSAGHNPQTDTAATSSEGLQECCIWEMYDVKRRELTVFADGIGDNEEVLFGPESTQDELGYPHPFTRIPCIFIPGAYYSMGFVEASSSLQSELNDQRLNMAELRRASIPKLITSAKYVDDIEEWMASGKVGAVATIEDDDADISRIVYFTTPPQVSPILFQHGGELLGDLDRQVGISAMERGVGLPGSSTATEVNAITGYVSARARSYLRGSRAAMEEVARRIITLMQHNMDQTDYLWLQEEFGMDWLPPTDLGPPIPNPRSKKVGVPYSGSMLAGEWQLKIRVDTGTADGSARREQKAQQFLQGMMPFMSAGVVNNVEVLRKFLTDTGIVNPDRFIAPQPAMQAPPTGVPGGMPSPAGQNATAVGGGATGAGLPPGMEQLMAEAGQRGSR